MSVFNLLKKDIKMSIFKPDFYFKNIFSVTPEFLKDNNIKALLLDADNTLCIFRTDVPVEGVMEWIDKMKSAGIELHICSNGKPGRLTRFSNNVNLPCFYMSLKPLPFKIVKLVKKLGFKREEVALIGDQLFTDILGGNRVGITTILTNPISKNDYFLTYINRMRENNKIRRLSKLDLFYKGKYYE